MLAAENGHTETVQVLIGAGADVNTCLQVSILHILHDWHLIHTCPWPTIKGYKDYPNAGC